MLTRKKKYQLADHIPYPQEQKYAGNRKQQQAVSKKHHPSDHHK